MSPSETVQFATKSDDAAHRISAVLSALGFEPERVSLDSNAESQRWALERIARRYKLTAREREVFELITLDGLAVSEIADKLQLSKATVKWHTHNIFTKTSTTSREALLRMANSWFLRKQTKP